MAESIGQYGGTIRRGFTGTADYIGVGYALGAIGLTFTNPDLSLRAAIAESWETNEDASEWTWQLVPIVEGIAEPDAQLEAYIDSFKQVVDAKYNAIITKLAIKHTTRSARALVKTVQYRLDINTLHRDEAAPTLTLNEIGRVSLRTTVPLFFDAYRRNRDTGSFILIDGSSHQTVAGGMVREVLAQAGLLAEVGLTTPEPMRIARVLAEAGFSVPADCLTVPETEEALWLALRR